jgi:hypothetical protein
MSADAGDGFSVMVPPCVARRIFGSSLVICV